MAEIFRHSVYSRDQEPTRSVRTVSERISERIRPLRIDRQNALRQADRVLDAELRLAMFETFAGIDNLPEEIRFQVDSGKLAGIDLIFNTREVKIYGSAPWQDHNYTIGVSGVHWFDYLDPILTAIDSAMEAQQITE